MFYDGYGTKTDMETALKWLEQAASGSMDATKAEAQSRHGCRQPSFGTGNHNAQYTVGKMYRDGTGTAPNMEKAILYISRAAESGNVYAKAALARLYLRSDEPSRHYQAEIVLNQLIKQSTGEQKSYFESVLGAAYYYSDTPRDTAKAKELLERAAQNSSEYAAVLLSRIAGHERNAVDSLLCSLMALLNSAEHYSNLDLQNASIELKNDTEMLTIKECSVIMRVSERTIRMLVKQNAIGSTRAGSGSCGKLLIPRSALLRYIDTL